MFFVLQNVTTVDVHDAVTPPQATQAIHATGHSRAPQATQAPRWPQTVVVSISTTFLLSACIIVSCGTKNLLTSSVGSNPTPRPSVGILTNTWWDFARESFLFGKCTDFLNNPPLARMCPVHYVEGGKAWALIFMESLLTQADG